MLTLLTNDHQMMNQSDEPKTRVYLMCAVNFSLVSQQIWHKTVNVADDWILIRQLRHNQFMWKFTVKIWQYIMDTQHREKKVLKNRTLEQKIVCYLPHTFELTSMYLLRCQMYQFVQWQNAWCQSFVEPRPTPYFSPLYSNDANCKNVKKVELVLWMRIYSPDIAS